MSPTASSGENRDFDSRDSRNEAQCQSAELELGVRGQAEPHRSASVFLSSIHSFYSAPMHMKILGTSLASHEVTNMIEPDGPRLNSNSHRL